MHAQLINTTLTKKRVKKLGASFYEGEKRSFRFYVEEKQIRKLLRNNQIQCQLESFIPSNVKWGLVKISDWKSMYVQCFKLSPSRSKANGRYRENNRGKNLAQVCESISLPILDKCSSLESFFPHYIFFGRTKFEAL